MPKTASIRTLAALFLALPAAAQTSTHLNVPAKQIVSITFFKGAGDGYGQFSGMQMHRADGSSVGSTVPAGQVLIIRELSISTNYGSSSPSPVSVGILLSQTDASNQFFYSGLRESFTIPSDVYAFNFHFKADVGLTVAGTLKPKVSISPNNGPWPLTAWDSVSVQGWGYLTSF